MKCFMRNTLSGAALLLKSLKPQPYHAENQLYLIHFDQIYLESPFFKFVYSFFIFSNWATSTILKSWPS